MDTNDPAIEKTESKGEDLSFDEVVRRMREIGKEITPKTLKSILRDTELQVEEFINLLKR